MSNVCKVCNTIINKGNTNYCSRTCFQKNRKLSIINRTEKLCPKCKNTQPIEKFTNNKNRCSSYCKDCEAAWMKAFRQSKTEDEKAKTKETIRNLKSRDYKTFLSSAIIYIKSRAKRKNIPFNISVEDLISLAEEQNFLCALTGDLLSFVASKGGINDNRKLTASIDRIVPELGYTKGNIQLVSFKANFMKNSLTLLELYETCEKILLKAKNEGRI